MTVEERTQAGTVVRCRQCGAKNRLRPSADATPRCGKCRAALPWVVSADESSFDAEVGASVPVVVDFWAPWCAPCRMIEPVLESLAEEHACRLKVVKVNVDETPGLARRYGAMSIPMLVVLRNGEELERIVGAYPPPELKRRLEPAINQRKEAPHHGQSGRD